MAKLLFNFTRDIERITNVEVKTLGVSGPTCLLVTQGLLSKMGGEVVPTEEMYAEAGTEESLTVMAD